MKRIVLYCDCCKTEIKPKEKYWRVGFPNEGKDCCRVGCVNRCIGDVVDKKVFHGGSFKIEVEIVPEMLEE